MGCEIGVVQRMGIREVCGVIMEPPSFSSYLCTRRNSDWGGDFDGSIKQSDEESK
jgi:hypothetical protein